MQDYVQQPRVPDSGESTPSGRDKEPSENPPDAASDARPMLAEPPEERIISEVPGLTQGHDFGPSLGEEPRIFGGPSRTKKSKKKSREPPSSPKEFIWGSD